MTTNEVHQAANIARKKALEEAEKRVQSTHDEILSIIEKIRDICRAK